MLTVLFFSRIFLYFIVITVPLWLRPSVAVPYDSVSFVAWFVVVPINMVLSYFLHHRRTKNKKIFQSFLYALICTTLLAIGFSGLDANALLMYFTLGAFSFLFTRFVFFSGKSSLLVSGEIFFFSYIYFKFLNFTRSTPEISQEYPIFPKILLLLLILSFLFHIAIVYLAAFPDRSFQKKRNELLAFSCIVLPLFLFLSFVLPSDFVKHQISFNEFNEDPPPEPKNIEEEGDGAFGGGNPEEEHNRNGKPLGEREEKYPSELQGDSNQKEKGIKPKQTLPEEKENQELDKKRKKGGKGGKDEQKPKNGNKGPKEKKSKDNTKEEEQESPSEDFAEPNKDVESPPSDLSKQSSGKGKSGPRLEGVPSDMWDSYKNSGDKKSDSGQGGGKQGNKGKEGSGGKQNSVMVVASKVQPIYAAEGYWGWLDEDGFSASDYSLEPLNKLTSEHLIDTWQDKIPSKDDKREIVPLYFLTTIKDRVLPYRPYRIQPTVQNTATHPFDLSYHAQARISTSQPNDWYLVRELNDVEIQKMAKYLDTSALPKKYLRDFKKHLSIARNIFETSKSRFKKSASPNSYFEKIEIILRGYAKHRYELGFEENITLDILNKFLNFEKKGDCTVFSQTAAILARLMGVPSRVVVGYLASKDLQTPTHKSALYHLREKMSLLKKFPLEELYLVTTSHHHSWVQYWLPNYGWVDFETTSYALPPPKGKDPNDMDVVIPLIDEKSQLKEPTFVFPWKFMLKLIAMICASFILGMYGFRYGRGLYFWYLCRRGGEKKLGALQMRLLCFLANEGYLLKPHYLTTIEFSEKLPIIKEFAELYTMLRFRMLYSTQEEKLEEIKNLIQ